MSTVPSIDTISEVRGFARAVNGATHNKAFTFLTVDQGLSPQIAMFVITLMGLPGMMASFTHSPEEFTVTMLGMFALSNLIEAMSNPSAAIAAAVNATKVAMEHMGHNALTDKVIARLEEFMRKMILNDFFVKIADPRKKNELCRFFTETALLVADAHHCGSLKAASAESDLDPLTALMLATRVSDPAPAAPAPAAPVAPALAPAASGGGDANMQDAGSIADRLQLRIDGLNDQLGQKDEQIKQLERRHAREIEGVTEQEYMSRRRSVRETGEMFDAEKADIIRNKDAEIAAERTERIKLQTEFEAYKIEAHANLVAQAADLANFAVAKELLRGCQEVFRSGTPEAASQMLARLDAVFPPQQPQAQPPQDV